MATTTAQQLNTQLKKIEHQLADIRGHLVLLEGDTQNKRAQVLQRTAGALKHKVMDDVVAWQKRIRSEWDA
ncbi:hypothetical protein A3B21_04840 [Candidatus Uhrbacteria bacterium RIFCSPLOWO2_01_FULL_47_24]|uniref:Uncharacterized protein n=1 Tax=Candidatus Uhrbacteria bacterium RIFCSPLOWO2_01_FULL_47_24 TaxID=1802401 RepID=A0A1F7UUT0_9BACT|nr:MAG: hypothetical protein A2753_00460 [Candidatus Uhrbacteria bacterium RIFCSPHIGHO2_01_FULL_47_11]OGL69279.1 MAG: hypothetical protein A3D58_03225 [Candidatus Uhrbacteria bacterium RIFCSPHIGHO2_02_FULL_46_47]OGL75114.1 MAG: hypothetical protein A3F52_03900 [Candidatus Uhrbacteria bacterium RIFCSPHIGHO2_12_FULL_47_11]OGL82015.1 MAG: hypothetical protein A3B21_04840 [Candidatus Uhrbacteria bacterium RIFCSPLOWO2_01_FULL_47_24]OGL85409.1 MAG: hypothetical protein A3J03_05005 [Candidatus Uhrbact